MFQKQVYEDRRKELMKSLGSGVVFFFGNRQSPANFPGNPYPFRQDSSFLYFWGLDLPDLNALIDVDAATATVFGNDPAKDDAIWSGPATCLTDRCRRIGAAAASAGQLQQALRSARSLDRPIHYLPPYRAAHVLQLSDLFKGSPQSAEKDFSEALVHKVVDLRSRKSAVELEQIEAALEVTADIHNAAMEVTRPGVFEREVAAAMEAIAHSAGTRLAYAPIFSVHGEILHNPSWDNQMTSGQLAVNDTGAESPMHYAADITRTLPVSGAFSQKQREIYQVVLDAQRVAIANIRPGVAFRDVHHAACLQIAAGLKQVGLMRGDPDEAVAAGAHTLFFPHGLGHMLGLDVHDMEALGEDRVGYTDQIRRDTRFGSCYLRLARELEAGFVVTVEPGIYFIPPLIDRWLAQKRCAEFIDFNSVANYRDFGGIRVEDDVVVNPDGCRILGPPIPRTPEAMEALAGKHWTD